MIIRLNHKKTIDVFDFISRAEDKYKDFYITINKERKYNFSIDEINKLLNYHICYGLYDNELKGILIIYKEKGFRPYIKILSNNDIVTDKMIKYLMWHNKEELFIKVKKTNPVVNILRKYGFLFLGDRGSEILLNYKPEKNNKKRKEYDKQFD